MRPKIKKWIDALRSGQYKQGKFNLCAVGEYCCLGVLCEILGVESKFADSVKYYRDSCTDEWKESSLPRQVQLELGITSLGNFKQAEGTSSLSYYNDKAKFTFDQIADLIEQIEKDDAWLNIRVLGDIDIKITHDPGFSVVPDSSKIDYLIYVLKGNCTLTGFEQTLYDMLMSGN